MDEQTRREIQDMINLSQKRNFRKKIGDTPTDALQLVPKKYSDSKTLSPIGGNSIVGAAFLAGGTNIYLTQSSSVITINQSVLGAAVIDVQTFLTTGTWTKPANAKITDVYLFGGGGGGGGGGPNQAGGGGGAGGGYSYKRFVSSILGTTEAVTVGVGGSGGTNVGANPGDNGNDGTDSKFGTTVYVVARGGGGGLRGASVTGGVGSQGNGDVSYAGSNGGDGGSAGQGNSGDNTSTIVSPRGGGGGGGTGNSGGNGGAFTTNRVEAGGLGGASCVGVGCVAGPGGIVADTDPLLIFGGVGGGGGGGGSNSSSTTGAIGGNGSFPGGGGGGGGYGSSTGQHGAGGAGANGVVLVITEF